MLNLLTILSLWTHRKELHEGRYRNNRDVNKMSLPKNWSNMDAEQKVKWIEDNIEE